MRLEHAREIARRNYEENHIKHTIFINVQDQFTRYRIDIEGWRPDSPGTLIYAFALINSKEGYQFKGYCELYELPKYIRDSTAWVEFNDADETMKERFHHDMLYWPNTTSHLQLHLNEIKEAIL